MKVLQIAAAVMLALSCFCLCHCASKNSESAPKVSLGFIPPDLSIKSRSIIPALSEQQAKEKKMNQLSALYLVKPETERVDFGTNTGTVRVTHVPSNPQVLQCDYPSFARGLAGMKDFINSKPAVYPERLQPDFHYADAAIYIRAKFRCLELPWGKVVMMLVQYTQGTHPPPPNSEDLRIWIRGISNDALRGQGGFCIAGDLTVKHLMLKTSEAASAEIEGKDEMQALSEAEKQLDSYSDDSFTPSLRDIEQMLRELQVEQDRS